MKYETALKVVKNMTQEETAEWVVELYEVIDKSIKCIDELLKMDSDNIDVVKVSRIIRDLQGRRSE